MKRVYFWLMGCVVALALTLTLLGRAPQKREDVEDSRPIRAPAVKVTLEIRSGAISPPVVSVSKGDRIALTVSNADRSRAEFELPGYEDYLSGIVIESGASWKGELFADRPGDDFAWMVNGKPAGRLVVLGSHLVEGHR